MLRKQQEELRPYYTIGNTGLEEAPATTRSRGRPRVMVTPIKDPSAKVSSNVALKAGQARKTAPVDFGVISEAVQIDGIAFQSVQKYLQLATNVGWTLQAPTFDSPALLYLRQRFQIFSRATGLPWEQLIVDSFRDFIQYANCFWARAWIPRGGKVAEGITLSPVYKSGVIGGFFRLAPERLAMVINRDTDQHEGWEYTRGANKKAPLTVDDVVHFSRNVMPGEVFGIPQLWTGLDDLRRLRNIENDISTLIVKYLNPLIHEQCPDTVGDGIGDQATVEDAYNNLAGAAPNSILVTGPGYKFTSIGAESKAIRAEGYWDAFLKRVLMDLGLSEMVMGSAVAVTAGAAEAIDKAMNAEAEMLQRQFETHMNTKVITDLLMEGGYDPYNNPDDVVLLRFNPISLDAARKADTHAADLWNKNTITWEEMRTKIGEDPTVPPENLYSQVVRLPEEWARAGVTMPAQADTSATSAVNPRQTTAGNAPASTQKAGFQVNPVENGSLYNIRTNKDPVATTYKDRGDTRTNDETLALVLSAVKKLSDSMVSEVDVGLSEFNPALYYGAVKATISGRLQDEARMEAGDLCDTYLLSLRSQLDVLAEDDTDSAHDVVLSNISSFQASLISLLD